MNNKMFLAGYFVLLALLGGIVVGSLYQRSRDMAFFKEAVKHDLGVAQNRGHVIGCEAAIRSYIGISPDDPTNPIWVEWCVKSAMQYSEIK